MKEGKRQKFDQFSASYEGRTRFCNASGRAGAELKLKAGQVERGFSGGPLLNLRTGFIMGIVVASRNLLSDLGGWAVEVPALMKILDDRGIQLPPVDQKWLAQSDLLHNEIPFNKKTLSFKDYYYNKSFPNVSEHYNSAKRFVQVLHSD